MTRTTQSNSLSAPEILPCPFCSETHSINTNYAGQGMVKCNSCGARVPSIDIWNLRPHNVLTIPEAKDIIEIKDIMTQAEVCNYIGVSKVTLWRLEKAGNGPKRIALGSGRNPHPRYFKEAIDLWLRNSETAAEVSQP